MGNLKKSLLVILSALLFAALTVVIALNFAKPANADDSLVFENNTAEYTFMNGRRAQDGSIAIRETDQFFGWDYDAETNTWYNGSYGKSYVSNGLNDYLILKVTKSGTLSFSLTFDKFLYTSGFVEGGILNVTVITPVGETHTVDDDFSFSWFYEPYNIEEYGDGVTYTWNSVEVYEGDWYVFHNSGKDHLFSLKGLKLPTTENFTATVKAENGGKIAYGEEQETSLTKTIAYNSTKDDKTVRAVPDPGYLFVRWVDSFGNIISQDDELTLYTWDETYTAVFAKEGATYNDSEWEYNAEGNYYITKEGLTSGTVSLTYLFSGEKTFSFDYGMSKAANLGSNPSFNLYVDNVRYDQIDWKSYFTSDPLAHYLPFTVGAKGEGLHTLEFDFSIKNAQTRGVIHNIREENFEENVTITLDFNDNLADFYVCPKNDLITNWSFSDKSSAIIENGQKLSKGKNDLKKQWYIGYAIEKSADILSTIDPDKHTAIAFDGFFVGDQMLAGNGQAISGNSMNNYENRKGYGFLMFFDGERFIYRISSNGEFLELNGDTLSAKFGEMAPLPDVSVMITAGGVTNPERVLQNGDTIDLVYGQTNSVNVVLSDLDNVEEDYSQKTVFDGKSLADSKIKIQSDVNKLYFTLPDIQSNKDLTISYSLEGYADSQPFIVHFRMQPPSGDLGDNLRYFGDFTIEDGGSWNGNSQGTAAWGFVADMYDSVNSRSTFRALNYNEENVASSGYVSNLRLTFTGGGTLSFEIQMEGYGTKNTYLLYNFGEAINKKPTESGAGATSGSAVGGKVLLYTANTGYDQVTKSVDEVTLTPLSGNWYSVSVSMESLYGGAVPEEQQTTLYLAYGVVNGNGLTGDFVIRNVGFSQGNVSVEYGVKGEGGEVTAQLGDKNYVSGAEIAVGSRLNFDVNLSGDTEFYAWVDGENNVLSFNKSFTYFVDGNISLYAVVAQKGQYKLRIGGNYYATLAEALSAAKPNDDIIIIRDYEITAKEGQSFDIPKDVSLIVAIDDEGTYYVEGGQVDRVVWEVDDKNTYLKRVFTVDSGVTLNIYGSMYVGGTLHRPNQTAQAHTSGNYAQLILNGDIVVKNGGVFDTNGRVTGDGGITVQNGGKLYQPFLILDFSGGTNTSGLFTLNQTPFSRYAMINIQCKKGYTIEYGGVLYGHASLYAMSTYTTIDQPFISYIGENAQKEEGLLSLINLKPDAKAVVVYDNDHAHIMSDDKNGTKYSGGNTEDIGKTTISLYGGATAGYMTFPFEITTKNVHFSIPYNYELDLESGDFEVLYDYKMMPGSTLWVKSGANLTLNADLLVYDGFYSSDMSGKNYPFAEKLTGAGYSATANFIVDGKLTIGKRQIVVDNKKQNVTFLGVVQSNSANAEISVDATATLSGDIVDGGLTGYDVNYATFKSSARVWDATHQTLRPLEAGKNYTSLQSDKTWTLPSLTVTYARNCNPGEEAHQDFPAIGAGILGGGRSGHVYDTVVLFGEESTVKPVMHGAWAVTHSDHIYEWEYVQGDLPTASLKIKKVEKYCTETGCTQSAVRNLLYTEQDLNIGSVAYKKAAITEADIMSLLKTYYGEEVESLVDSITLGGEYIGQGVNYDVTVRLKDGSYFYADGEESEFKFRFSVIPATITGLTLSISEKEYDGKAVDSSVVGSVNIAGGIQLDSGDYDITITSESGGENSANAGRYTIKVTGKNNAAGSAEQTFTITPIKITLKVKEGLVAEYIDKNHAPVIPQSAYEIEGNFHSGERIDVTVKYAKDDNVWAAGTSYELTAEYVFTGVSEDNYAITVTGNNITINKKAVEISVKGKSAPYSESAGYDETWQLEGVSGFGDDFTEEDILAKLTITCDVNTNNSATDHTITVVWKDGQDNFENFDVTLKETAIYSISPAEYGSLSFGGQTEVEYDGQEHSLTLECADGSITVKIYYKLHTAGDEDYSLTCPKDVGQYDVKAVLSSENYNGGEDYEFKGGTLTITKAGIDSVRIEGSYTYNGEVQQVTATVTANGVTLTAEDYDISCADLTSATGEEGIEFTVTAGQGSRNFEGSATTTLKIAKAELTVKIKNQSKEYDGAAPELSQSEVEYTGLQGGDDIGLSLSLAQSGKDAQKYRINYTATTESVIKNYDIKYVTESDVEIDSDNYPYYEITKKDAYVTLGDLTSVYGDGIKNNYSVKTKSGFIAGDGYDVEKDLNYTCAVQEKSHATDYPITATLITGSDNYNIHITDGNYKVTKRPVTVTIDSKTSVYDGTEPDLSEVGWTAEGVVTDDNLNITLHKEEGADAGKYKITGSYNNSDYEVEWVDGEWTIEKYKVTADEIYLLATSDEEALEYVEDGGIIYAVFTGGEVTIIAQVYLKDSEQPLEIKINITNAVITEAGAYEVTATIDDKNYEGTKTQKFILSPDIEAVLERLFELAGNLTPDTLTADDFAKVKEVYTQLNLLSPAVREEDIRLVPYIELVEAWNEYAQVDEDVIATAEKIADAPISGIIAAAVSTLAIVLAAAYAIGKGGLL